MNYYMNQINENGCHGIVHEIKNGDTLYKLSRLYDVSMSDLMDANTDINIYNLRIGDLLCIPMKEPRPMMNERTPDQMQMPSEQMPPDWMNRNQNGQKVLGTKHTVKEGETLGDVLRMHGITYEELIDYNKNMQPLMLRPGEVLFIPPR